MTPEGWQLLPAEVALDATSRIGWKGLNKSDFTTEGPYLITGMHFRNDGRIDWSACFRIPQWRYDESPEVMVCPDDILLTKDGTIGKVVHVRELPGPAALNSHLYLLRPTATGPSPRFLFYVLQSEGFRQFVGLNASGSTIIGLPWKVFRNFEIPVPPISEQRKIAAILSSVDDAIEATQAVIDQLQVVKKAMMAELLTRGLPGRHTRFKQTELGTVPEEWEVTAVGQIGPSDRPAAQTGPFGAQLRPDDFVESGTPVLRIGNVQWGYLDLDDLDFVRPEKAQELARFQVREGDLLFARQGATTGRNALADSRCAGWVINYHIIRVATDRTRCLPEFLMTCFNSDLVQKQVGREKGRGNRDGINTANILAFRLPLPKLDEQREITQALARLDQSAAASEASRQQLASVKSAFMSVLLTGELRVTPDEAAA